MQSNEDYSNQNTEMCDQYSRRKYTPFHQYEYSRNTPLVYLNHCQNAANRVNEYIQDLSNLNMMHLSGNAVRKRDEYNSNVSMITNSILRSPYASREMRNSLFPSVPVNFMFSKTKTTPSLQKLKRKSPKLKRKSPKF